METVKRTKVVDLLKSTAYGSIVNVKGWVRTHRSSKAVDFIALNDGSTINNIQIVVDPSKVDENQLRQITTGACISAVGTLVESQGHVADVFLQVAYGDSTKEQIVVPMVEVKGEWKMR